jgi:hypothetical protein
MFSCHPSITESEALAKYADCENSKYAEYEIYAEYVEISKTCRI